MLGAFTRQGEQLLKRFCPEPSGCSLMKFVLISATCLAFLACQSNRIAQWPDALPDRELFIAAYAEDIANQGRQTQREYLTWILSFYEGNLIYASGWVDVQAMVLANTAPLDRNGLHVSLQELGASIAAEWAKHNDLRGIDSRMLSLWGSVLQIASSSEARQHSIEVISADVDSLLNGSLLAAEIQDSRYEQILELDLFGGF